MIKKQLFLKYVKFEFALILLPFALVILTDFIIILYIVLAMRIQNLLHLFFPSLCACCNRVLLKNEKVLCTFCRNDLPIIETQNHQKNTISSIFYGRIPIKNVVSFLYYRKEGITKKLIQELKYNGNQSIGTFLGNWFGKELKEKNVFSTVDYIIPVPLHPKKEKSRGYNQLTTFGKSLSNILQIPYKSDILSRVSSSKTQTLQQRFERFSNVDTKFFLKDTATLENKHVLLIDDVITTGATLEACCNELLKTKNITISIATIAYTERT